MGYLRGAHRREVSRLIISLQSPVVSPITAEGPDLPPVFNIYYFHLLL